MISQQRRFDLGVTRRHRFHDRRRQRPDILGRRLHTGGAVDATSAPRGAFLGIADFFHRYRRPCFLAPALGHFSRCHSYRRRSVTIDHEIAGGNHYAGRSPEEVADSAIVPASSVSRRRLSKLYPRLSRRAPTLAGLYRTRARAKSRAGVGRSAMIGRLSQRLFASPTLLRRHRAYANRAAGHRIELDASVYIIIVPHRRRIISPQLPLKMNISVSLIASAAADGRRSHEFDYSHSATSPRRRRSPPAPPTLVITPWRC